MRSVTEGAHVRSAVPRGTYLLCLRSVTEGAHARSAVPRGTYLLCLRSVTEGAHARSASARVTERECPRNGTEGAHARSASARVTERECPRNGTEGAHARSASARVTERPPLGVLPHALPLSGAGVSRPRGLSPRHGRRRGGFALMRIAPATAGVIFWRDTPAKRRAFWGRGV